MTPGVVSGGSGAVLRWRLEGYLERFARRAGCAEIEDLARAPQSRRWRRRSGCPHSSRGPASVSPKSRVSVRVSMPGVELSSSVASSAASAPSRSEATGAVAASGSVKSEPGDRRLPALNELLEQAIGQEGGVGLLRDRNAPEASLPTASHAMEPAIEGGDRSRNQRPAAVGCWPDRGRSRNRTANSRN